MKVKYLVSEAIQVSVHFNNWYSEIFTDLYDDIESKLMDYGYTYDRLLDRQSFGEEYSNGTEVLTFSLDKTKSIFEEESDMLIGVKESIEIDEELANALNENDIYGNKDFEDGDIFSVSDVYHKRPNFVEYKVETYIVTEKPIDIDFEDESEGTNGLHTSNEQTETAEIVNEGSISEVTEFTTDTNIT